MLAQELSSFLPVFLDHFWGQEPHSEVQRQMYSLPGASPVTASGAGDTIENRLGYLVLPSTPPAPGQAWEGRMNLQVCVPSP